MAKTDADKAQHIVHADVQAVIDRLHAGAVPALLSEDQKVIMLALIREGATMTAVCRRAGMPKLTDIYATCEVDKAFAAALDQARRVQATSRLDRAQDVLDDAVSGGDVDDIRAAAVYATETTRYAEKIAPREYGQLVKLAGADGGALTVQITDYSNATGEVQGAAAAAAMEYAAQTSRARFIEHGEEAEEV